jgi:hypothetical protein
MSERLELTPKGAKATARIMEEQEKAERCLWFVRAICNTHSKGCIASFGRVRPGLYRIEVIKDGGAYTVEGESIDAAIRALRRGDVA